MYEKNDQNKAVVFDLDGTLVDTIGDLAGAMNYALQANGRPTRSVQLCRSMVGNGVRKFASRALGPDCQDIVDRVMKQMMAYYLDHCTEKSTVYSGINQLISNLTANGTALAVLTNKDQSAAESIIKHHFNDSFTHIIGTAGGNAVKPEPSALLGLLDLMGVRPEDAFMVGDSEPDVQVAIAAGVKPIAVSWGFRSCQELLDAGAEIIVDSPGEILDLVA